MATYDVSHPRWDGLDRLSAIEQALANANGGSGSLPGGGTSGQVLEKLSGADGDAGWATPLSPSSDATISGLWNFTQTPEVNGVPISSSSIDTGLGTKIWVPGNAASGQILAAPLVDNAATVTWSSSLLSMVPFRVVQNVSGYVGFYVNTAGTAATVYAGVWNSHATQDRPGTQLDFFSAASVTATTQFFSATQVSLQAGVTYWWGTTYAGTAAPASYDMRKDAKLVAQGWADNVSFGTRTWRYSPVTVATDLTATNPTTGDFNISVPVILIKVA